MSDSTQSTKLGTTDTPEDLKFDNDINRLGRFGSIIALLAMLAVPIVTTLVFSLNVNISDVISILSGLAAMFIPMAVIENISYYAIVGAGGVYLGSITGNVLNMKLPSAVAGMKIAGVEPGSRQGDIISILSIGASSIVTIAIVLLGAMFLGPIVTPVLSNPALAPGFANVMPALMGALLVPAIKRSPKIAAVPVILSIGLCLILGFRFVQGNQSYFLPAIMVCSVIAARIMYNKGALPQKPMQQKGDESNDNK